MTPIWGSLEKARKGALSGMAPGPSRVRCGAGAALGAKPGIDEKVPRGAGETPATVAMEIACHLVLHAQREKQVG